MQVEMWPLSRVKPYPSNPRINDHAVDAVAASIREFGFRQPIVVDEDGVIVVGNTRYKAALMPYNVRLEPRSNNAIAAGLSSFEGAKHHQKFDVERHPEKSQATHKKMRAKDRPLANDYLKDAEFDKLLLAWFGQIARVLEPGRAFYLWGGYSNIGNYPPALAASGLYFSQAIIWDKQHPVLTRKDYMGAHEWCFYAWREGAAHQFFLRAEQCPGPVQAPAQQAHSYLCREGTSG